MWLLFASLLGYLVYGLTSEHFRRSLLPVRPQQVMRDLRAAFRGRLMAAIVLFLVVHLSLTLLVPKVLPPMITGRARGRR